MPAASYTRWAVRVAHSSVSSRLSMVLRDLKRTR